MKPVFHAAAVLALLAAPAAHAGSMSAPPPEPMPAAPVPAAPAMPMSSDWTGGYAGLSLGSVSAETGAIEETGAVYGIFGGYDYDFGSVVVGGELDFQATDDFSLGGADIDNVTRLKVRGGYDAGPALLYATAGAARADTSIGDADGAVYGVGLDYKVTERVTVGLEYLRHDFDDINDTGVDVDADTISLRGALRF